MTQLKSGTQLHGGRYRIEGVVNRGAFGIVYRAVDSKRRRIAIKELFPEVCRRKEFSIFSITIYRSNSVQVKCTDHEWNNYLNRFTVEMSTLAQLSHPSIVKIVDAFSENQTAYIVMEFLDGSPVSKLTERGALDAATVRHFVKSVCSALQYAHSHGVCHRDVKPENILWCTDGRVVLVDFGISKDFVLDVVKSQAGTPAYMSLEQFAGEEQGDHTDVYGLGATVYHLATGTLPVNAGQRFTDMHQRKPDPLIPTIKLARGLKPCECDAIDRALALMPSDRTPTISEFYAEFTGKRKVKLFESPKNEGGCFGIAFVAAAIAATAVCVFAAFLRLMN